MKEKEHIGELIKEEAKKLCITNTEFAKRLNLHRTSINHIYSCSSIDLHRLLEISDILDFDFISNYFCPCCMSKKKLDL